MARNYLDTAVPIFAEYNDTMRPDCLVQCLTPICTAELGFGADIVQSH